MIKHVKTWGPLFAVAVLVLIALVAPHFAALLGLGGVAAGMVISFNDTPNNIRVPYFTAEFDNSKASSGPALLAYRGLIIGQKIAAGTATADTLVDVTNEKQAIAAAGRGSMLHRMAAAWFAKNKSTPLTLGVLADNGAGVAATKTVTITGPATAAGTLNVYVGGRLQQVAVASGDSATVVGDALAVVINADGDCAMTAADVTGVVTLTHRHKGLVGQACDVRVNYQPSNEATPAGLTVAVANVVSGITNPVLTGLIAAMGDSWFQIIAHPYTDATSLTALEAELHDRFGPMRQIDGLAITCGVGSNGTLASLGNTRNSPHNCILAQPGGPTAPTTLEEFAARAAAVVAFYGAIDPARPFQTLPLGALAPAEADLFQTSERNILLFDGIATTRVMAGGEVQIERLITTYKTNSAGSPDTSYLDANTLLTLMYLRYSFNNAMAQEFPRHKLGGDDSVVGAGQAIITPRIGRAFAVSWFQQMMELGLVEGLAQFKADLQVERDISNPTRLNFLTSPDLMNQLIVSANKIQFKL